MLNQEAEAIWTFNTQVIPAPLGLQVWIVWRPSKSNQQSSIDGPFDVLAIAVGTRSLTLAAEVENDYQELNGKRIRLKRYTHDAYGDPEEAVDSFDYNTTRFLIKADGWELNWVELHGEDSYDVRYSETGAKEQADEYNEKVQRESANVG